MADENKDMPAETVQAEEHFYSGGEQTDNPAVEAKPLAWTGPEFLAHDKSGLWYMSLLMASAILAGLIYLITRDIITAIVVMIAAATLAGYGARKPKQVQYQVDGSGVSIGKKRYSYGDFRSFSVAPEGQFVSFDFMPLKRFSPPASIYCAPDDEAGVTDFLADRLPLEPRRTDPVDNFMRYIRF